MQRIKITMNRSKIINIETIETIESGTESTKTE